MNTEHKIAWAIIGLTALTILWFLGCLIYMGIKTWREWWDFALVFIGLITFGILLSWAITTLLPPHI